MKAARVGGTQWAVRVEPAGSTERMSFGILEKALHALAFRTVPLQRLVSELESDLHRRQLDAMEIDRPVFVTALPRCGTTILLEQLAATGAFATQTYRSMPFPLCPLLWKGASRSFGGTGQIQERFHGDGLLVSPDSPESFEEVIWRALYPDAYGPTVIGPWPNTATPEESAFFRDFVKKITFGQRGIAHEIRYISKNNNNIYRVDLIKSIFPNSIIVVMFRNPLSQVNSILHQSRKFTVELSKDRFAESYLSYLGHFEFGFMFRPSAVHAHCQAGLEPGSAEAVACYWIEVYQTLLARQDDVMLIDYDWLCQSPEPSMLALGRRLGIAERLAQRSAALRPAAARFEPLDVRPGTCARMIDLHATLRKVAMKQLQEAA